MDLSVVILNYKCARMTRQCVRTLLRFAPSRSFEIVVVDNASGDGIGAIVEKEFSAAPALGRFVQSSANGGFAAGNNLGIRASAGRYVLIMNPDITVLPGSLDALLSYMDANREVGIAGPQLVQPTGEIDESCFREPETLIPVYRRTPFGRTRRGREAIARYLMVDYARAVTADVDWLLGAALCVRREAIDRVGMLDERFFLYFEDTDWCRRFRNDGWRVVYVPGARMVHYHERESAQAHWARAFLTRSTRVHVASWIKYLRKWHGK